MPLNFFKNKKSEKLEVPAVENRQNVAEQSLPQTPIVSNEIKHVNPSTQPIIDIQAKEKENLKKKRTFKIVSYTLLISLFLVYFLPSAVNYYQANFLRPKPRVENPDDNMVIVDPNKIDPESVVEYSSDDLKLSLEHLRKATLFENKENSNVTKKVEIIYDKNNNGQNTSLDKLTEGYIFRISVFPTYLRKIDDIAKVKNEAFTVSCPETSTITKPNTTTVNDIEGRNFEVTNCGSDYKVTYVVKNNLNYEFAQIFKGDYGYRQAYKAETENILNSIVFYPDERPDLGPLETYISEDYKFSFEYPRSLDVKCCNLTGPVSESATKLLILGNPQTYVDDNNQDVIGFFVDSNRMIDFTTYIENQKNLLTDDYIVTRGESPKPEIRTVKVGDLEGTMLRGYSWRENDLTYIDLSATTRTRGVLVISTKNASGEDFENVIKSILDSFKFSLTE